MQRLDGSGRTDDGQRIVEAVQPWFHVARFQGRHRERQSCQRLLLLSAPIRALNKTVYAEPRLDSPTLLEPSEHIEDPVGDDRGIVGAEARPAAGQMHLVVGFVHAARLEALRAHPARRLESLPARSVAIDA